MPPLKRTTAPKRTTRSSKIPISSDLDGAVSEKNVISGILEDTQGNENLESSIKSKKTTSRLSNSEFLTFPNSRKSRHQIRKNKSTTKSKKESLSHPESAKSTIPRLKEPISGVHSTRSSTRASRNANQQLDFDVLSSQGTVVLDDSTPFRESRDSKDIQKVDSGFSNKSKYRKRETRRSDVESDEKGALSTFKTEPTTSSKLIHGNQQSVYIHPSTFTIPTPRKKPASPLLHLEPYPTDVEAHQQLPGQAKRRKRKLLVSSENSARKVHSDEGKFDLFDVDLTCSHPVSMFSREAPTVSAFNAQKKPPITYIAVGGSHGDAMDELPSSPRCPDDDVHLGSLSPTISDILRKPRPRFSNDCCSQKDSITADIRSMTNLDDSEPKKAIPVEPTKTEILICPDGKFFATVTPAQIQWTLMISTTNPSSKPPNPDADADADWFTGRPLHSQAPEFCYFLHPYILIMYFPSPASHDEVEIEIAKYEEDEVVGGVSGKVTGKVWKEPGVVAWYAKGLSNDGVDGDRIRVAFAWDDGVGVFDIVNMTVMTCPIRLPLPTPTIDTSQTAKTLTPPFSHLKQVENSSRHLLGVTSTDHVHLWSVQSSPPKLLGSYNFNDRLNINQVVVLHAFTPIEFSDIVDAYILDQQSNADDGARRDQDHVERYFDRFEMNVFCVIAGQCTKVDKEQVDDSNFPSFGKETSSGNDVWKFGLVQISPDGLTMIWSWVLCVDLAFVSFANERVYLCSGDQVQIRETKSGRLLHTWKCDYDIKSISVHAGEDKDVAMVLLSGGGTVIYEFDGDLKGGLYS